MHIKQVAARRVALEVKEMKDAARDDRLRLNAAAGRADELNDGRRGADGRGGKQTQREKKQTLHLSASAPPTISAISLVIAA